MNTIVSKNKKQIILVALLAFVVIAFLIAAQSYMSYVEITTASNNCYDNGGFPVVEKSGFKMTYFHCNM
ncbi:hypothetical protein [Alkalihalobacillus sp. LMS39]|uniref:hypothetical protein n=1 Tax=Alkalihalobacillus sp. LMS39 TaxID=2924032 RepID=UPI001FB49340|nr:hypothetical protein [Alkalihalobacillus sp. LMS39]UOE94702.1 hypothetical protein MM271_03375 [Alkalihalobacillus sp. LMS39]